MPTERFYRLPEEKKRSICSAAVKEFARVPLDKVSINQIIKEADISRDVYKRQAMRFEKCKRSP